MIEFPKLGLEFEISRETSIKIFGQPVYWYGVLIAAAFMIAILIALRECERFGINQDTIIDLILFELPASIIGARLYYVIFTWDEFKDDIWSVFNTRRGGLAIYGGIIAALVVAWLFARWKKIQVWKLMDFGVVYIPLGQAIGRWGNFINQEAFGTNTNLPWGMTGDEIREQLVRMKASGMSVNPDLPVHPTFLYESLWNIGVFLILHWYRKRKKADEEVVCLYMILYGLGRSWIEGLRTDSLMLGNIRVSQLLAIVFFIAFSILFYVRRKKTLELEEESTVTYTSEFGNILKMMREDEMKEEDAFPEKEELSEETSTSGENEAAGEKETTDMEVHEDTLTETDYKRDDSDTADEAAEAGENDSLGDAR